MPRTKDTRTKREKAWDRVLAYFDGQRSAMNDAINMQLKIRGKETVTRQAIEAWRSNGVPPINVIAVELATDGVVKREVLRPELYR